ncbi:glycosyltransferase [Plantactinospora sonchi]|uniref:Glycosyltransferase n=1 Tax=Plantactinospora sonchi TaxID=1544735 RepID=A0ABU7RRE5_9ACTN
MLYLSFYFPPSRASGVYRARATANHLAARGWDVTACAAPLDFLRDVLGSLDTELASTVDPTVRVERPALHRFAWERDLRRYGRFRRTFPRAAQKLYQLSQRLGFPEHYASWGLAAVARGLRAHRRRRFDVVLATGNPFASFGAAWLFHRLTGVPYVLDYRDSWTLDLFTNRPAFPAGHPAWRWERRVLSRASGIVFVNEALRDWHAERYPAAADRMLVVPNGWDPDLAPVSTPPGPASETTGSRTGVPVGPTAVVGAPADDSGQPGEPGGRTGPRFGYLGTVTRVQPLEELVAAFRLAREHGDLADAELRIHGHLGFSKTSPTELTARLGLTGGTGIRYLGPVTKTEVHRVYAESDVLVFLAGGSRYVTSGKIFEYMASGRPIVSVHAPGIAAEEVLAEYPLWFTARSLDPAEVARSMVAAAKAARDLDPEQRSAAARHADRYARDLMLAPLEARLRALTPVAGPSASATGEDGRHGR